MPLSRGVLLASFGRVRTSKSLVIVVYLLYHKNSRISFQKKKKIESQGTRVPLYGTETLSHCMTDRKLGYHGCLRTGVFKYQITYNLKNKRSDQALIHFAPPFLPSWYSYLSLNNGLSRNFQLEEDIKKTLLQYYNMKEILLPLKKPGEPMIPWQLVKFYKEILNEMAQSLITDKMEEEDRFGEEFFTFESVEKDTTKKSEKKGYKLSRKRKKRRGMNQYGKRTSIRGSSRRRKKNEIASDLSTTDSERRNCPTFSIFDETLLNDVPLPTTDPEEIQRLLFCKFLYYSSSSSFLFLFSSP